MLILSSMSQDGILGQAQEFQVADSKTLRMNQHNVQRNQVLAMSAVDRSIQIYKIIFVLDGLDLGWGRCECIAMMSQLGCDVVLNNFDAGIVD